MHSNFLLYFDMHMKILFRNQISVDGKRGLPTMNWEKIGFHLFAGYLQDFFIGFYSS